MGASAPAVIIGGGVIGCSLAYHLGRAGWRDTVLLEQHELTEGTTWHTAGFVTSMRGPDGPGWHARLAGYLPALAAMLRAETGLDPGWRPVGGLRLALSHTHVDELRRLARRADELGVPLELRGASATMNLAPRLDLTDVQAAAWLPGEGFVRPKDFVGALVAGARTHGADIRTGVRVTGIDATGGAVRAVHTSDGVIETPVVVNAAGAAAGAVGALAGVGVPVVPVLHQYGVTDVLQPALDPDTTPTCRVPEQQFYLRGANGAVIIGGSRPDPVAAWPAGDAEPLAKARDLAEPDDAAFARLWQLARARMPELAQAKLAKIMHGVEAYTPDGAPLAGPTTLPGLWIAAGGGLHGMALAGGLGRHLAEWITTGSSTWDLTALLPDRFGPSATNRDWLTTRALATLART
ncbi:FAD-dependent oxidoreductase [Catellatospora sp. KI3]|uniref:NAD(P)/FAD-dependent oxidoreductase n=1 Tax=Catellatospora sp. KI3 TaxID=3041620 RepID=UPI0024830279|nr:FAD-dependent oxidoreductase [Catellatospora sp. KI3]MDI1459440.1 FAD-dependent oxidoreductase [Catellatospora sp. KI3]